MSASAITAASEGAGSNVWLFVPSGTMPVTCTRSPPMFCTMFVTGETVVATWTRFGSASVPPRDDEQAAPTSANAATTIDDRFIRSERPLGGRRGRIPRREREQAYRLPAIPCN